MNAKELKKKSKDFEKNMNKKDQKYFRNFSALNRTNRGLPVIT